MTSTQTVETANDSVRDLVSCPHPFKMKPTESKRFKLNIHPGRAARRSLNLKAVIDRVDIVAQRAVSGKAVANATVHALGAVYETRECEHICRVVFTLTTSEVERAIEQT